MFCRTFDKGYKEVNSIKPSTCERCSSWKYCIHYCGIPGEIKDVSGKQMLRLLYNTEFSGTKLESVGIGSANFEELLHEDKKFLEIMDENKKKVGKHYQLPLPMKSHKKFSNKRYLAEKRLQYMKGWFIKEPKFFMDYKSFVDDLIKKSLEEKNKNLMSGFDLTNQIVGVHSLNPPPPPHPPPYL